MDINRLEYIERNLLCLMLIIFQLDDSIFIFAAIVFHFLAAAGTLMRGVKWIIGN